MIIEPIRVTEWDQNPFEFTHDLYHLNQGRGRTNDLEQLPLQDADIRIVFTYWRISILNNCPTLFCFPVEQRMYHVAKQDICEPLPNSVSWISKELYQPPLTNLNRLTYITHNYHSEISFTATTTKILDMCSAQLLYNKSYIPE